MANRTEQQWTALFDATVTSIRRAVDFLSVIELLSEQGVSVYIHQNGLETLQPDGKSNPIAQLVLGILAQFNSMERGLIRSRMESGYNHYRSCGGVVGRKKEYKKTDEQMKSHFQLSQPNLSHVNFVCMGSKVSKKDGQYF